MQGKLKPSNSATARQHNPSRSVGYIFFLRNGGDGLDGGDERAEVRRRHGQVDDRVRGVVGSGSAAGCHRAGKREQERQLLFRSKLGVRVRHLRGCRRRNFDL